MSARSRRLLDQDSRPAAVSFASASGTSATRRSPGAVSRATPIFMRGGSLSVRMGRAWLGDIVASSTNQELLQVIPVARLNHAVLYVRDAEASADFYARVFGFEVVSSELKAGPCSCALRAPTITTTSGCSRSARKRRGAPRGSPPLPLAWEVATIEDLAAAASQLLLPGRWAARATRRSKSLTARIGRQRVRDHVAGTARGVGRTSSSGTVMPLDLDAEVRRWGRGAGPPN